MSLDRAPLETPATLALIAYADDRVVRGAIRLRHARLADLLEEGDPLDVEFAAAESRQAGEVIRLGAIRLDQDQLTAVIATGPAGTPSRRLVTRGHTARLVADDHEVLGLIHVPVGQHPEVWLEGRRWIAVTDAVVWFTSNGRERAQLHETVLVNRARLSVFEPVAPEVYERRHAFVEAIQGSPGRVIPLRTSDVRTAARS